MLVVCPSGSTETPAGAPPASLAGRLLWSPGDMATHITDACINCGACEPECPNEAISQGEDVYVIDRDRCTECVGFHEKEACQGVCPVECCLPDPANVETEAQLIARAMALHPDDAELAAKAKSGEFASRFRN